MSNNEQNNSEVSLKLGELQSEHDKELHKL